MSYFTEIAESIKKHEDFRPKPYPDPLAVKEHEVLNWHKLHVTIGYGFTNVTKEEAQCMLDIRIRNIARELLRRIPRFITYPMNVKMVLIEMAFQMGVDGLLRFEKMLKALDEHDYDLAALEIKRSKLYRETESRARDYMARIMGGE